MITEQIRKVTELYPDYPAVIMPQKETTYREVYDEALRAAGKLRRLGVKKGDYINIELTRDEKYAAVMLAEWMCGAAVAAADSAYPAERLDYIAADCGAKVRVRADFPEGLESEAPAADLTDPEPSDPARTWAWEFVIPVYKGKRTQRLLAEPRSDTVRFFAAAPADFYFILTPNQNLQFALALFTRSVKAFNQGLVLLRDTEDGFAAGLAGGDLFERVVHLVK
ncbi:MAG: AMP-binding protein [Oscillospiraceae bacterium]|nr:AMP-binding protein [Oscillospiraceae bacterium]